MLSPRMPRALVWVLGLVALLSLPNLTHELVWDDLHVIARGDVIFDITQLPSVFAHRTMYVSARNDVIPVGATDTYRPVTLTTFFWDAAISGRAPWAYHVTNMLMHLMCVALVFFLCRRFLPDAPAWFGAAFFGVTPQLAEAHVWINGRSDLVAALFSLCALLVATRNQSRWRFALTWLLASLAMLGKETAVFTVPLAFALPLALSLRERILRGLPFLLGACTYVLMRSAALSGAGVSTSGAQLTAALGHLPELWLHGLRELFLPNQLFVHALVNEYAATPVAHVAAYASALLFVGVFLIATRMRVAFWGFGWFLAALAPAMMLTTILWLGFGRFLYVPAIGAALMLTEVAQRVVAAWRARDRNPRLVALIAGAYVFFLSARFLVYAHDWRNEIALYSAITVDAPEQAHGWGWLGMTWLELGEYARAIDALQKADALERHDARYRTSWVDALIAMGDHVQAEVVLTQAAAKYPNDARVMTRLADLIVEQEPERAASLLSQCVAHARFQQMCVNTMMTILRREATSRFADALSAAIERDVPPADARRLRVLFAPAQR